MYLTECKPDTVLLQILTGTSRRNISHAGNKSEVLRKLAERFTNSKGVIDEDPWAHQPPLLSKFEEEEQDLTTYEIRVFRQKSRNNLLIMLCPRLEDWILKAANEVNIRPEQFGLPKSPEELHRLINIRTDNFEKLIESIKDKSDRVKKLVHCLKFA